MTEYPEPQLEISSKASTIGIFLLLIGLMCFIASLCVNPSTANDLFWQLRTGREIVASHHVPYHDTYSWTRAGTPWVVHEWLAFVLLWEAYRMGEFAGVWILQTLILTLTFVILFFLLLRETGKTPLTALILTVISAVLCSAFFQPRPQIFTYLFSAITIGLMLRVRTSPHSKAILWWFIPLSILWANMHAGVLIGLGVFLTFAVGDVVEAYLNRENSMNSEGCKSAARTKFIIGTLAVLATLLNPYGWHIYQNIAATLSNATAMNAVLEWKSPNFHDSYGKILELYLAMVLGVMIFSRERKYLTDFIILAVLAHQSLSALRNIPLLGLIGTLIIAPHFSSALQRALSITSSSSPSQDSSFFGKNPPLAILFAISISIIVLACVRSYGLIHSPSSGENIVLQRVALLSFGMQSYPEKACRFMIDERIPTTFKLYNSYSDGGYLIWRLPQYPVFVDGRADIYFGNFLDKAGSLHDSPYSWRQTLDSYGCNIVLISVTEEQSRLFLAAPDWAVIYADDLNFDLSNSTQSDINNTIILVKRLPKNNSLIKRCRKDCIALQDRKSWSMYRQYPALW